MIFDGLESSRRVVSASKLGIFPLFDKFLLYLPSLSNEERLLRLIEFCSFAKFMEELKLFIEIMSSLC
jgi:hypothetical protein